MKLDCAKRHAAAAWAWDSRLNLSLRWQSKPEALADITKASVGILRILRKERRSQELRFCEVNVAAGPDLARAVLCRAPSNVRYVGFDVANSTTAFERKQFTQSLGRGQVIHRATAPVRSVLAIKMRNHKALPVCDLLVVNLDDAHAKWRQALLLDLANSLLLTATRNFIIAHGHNCGPESNRTHESYVAANWKEFPEQCWDEAWREYVDRREVIEARCEVCGDRRSRFCVGRVNHSSHCTRSPPLLQRSSRHSSALRRVDGFPAECGQSSAPVTIVPADTDWLNSFKFKFFRDYRYFSLVPCEASTRASLNASRASHADASTLASGSFLLDAVEEAWHGGGLCLLFKDGVFETWVAGLDSADGGRSFIADPQLVIPRFDRRIPARFWGLPKQASLSHNYAVIRSRDQYLLVGGTYSRNLQGNNVKHRGIFMLRGKDWKWSNSATTPLAPVYKGRGNFEPL